MHNHRAIVWVAAVQFHKLAKGIVLPNGYTLVDVMPFTDNLRMAVGFMVESEDIEYTEEGNEYPVAFALGGYQQIVVEAIK